MKSEQKCHKSYLISGNWRLKFQRNLKYSLFCTHTHTKTHTEITVVHEGQKYIMHATIHWLYHCLITVN
jgi:hypothetical protein